MISKTPTGVEIMATSPWADGAPSGSRPSIDDLRYAHDTLLRRTLAYIGGALAAFFPLFEFVLLSQEVGRVLLPLPVAIAFVVVGTILSAALSGAALGSFLELMFLRQSPGLDPDEMVRSLHPKSGLVGWYAGLLQSPTTLFDLGAAAAWLVVVGLLVALDLSLLWV